MARPRDEDLLEPVLPKHPPTEREAAEAAADAAVVATPAPSRPSWDRIVLVACAVVATLSLVVVAARASSIAKDQKIQTCQIRVYAAQRSDASFGGRDAERRLAQQLAECVGIDPANGDDTTD
jgi:hypothetical protein